MRATIRRTLCTTLLMGGIIATVLVWRDFTAFAGRLERYCELAISSDKDEVRYRRGLPPIVLGPVEHDGFGPSSPIFFTDRQLDPKNSIPEGMQPEDYHEWQYPAGDPLSAGPYVSVEFDTTGVVKSISCYDTSPSGIHCPSLIGVSIGSTEEQVVDLLGAPDRSSLEGVTKTMSFDDVGIELFLSKRRVYLISLLNTPRSRASILQRYLRSRLAI